MRFNIVLLTAFSLLVLTGCGKKKAQRQAFDPTLPVEISVIEQTDDNTFRNYVGVTKSEMELPVAFPMGGTLTVTYLSAHRRYHDLSGQ